MKKLCVVFILLFSIQSFAQISQEDVTILETFLNKTLENSLNSYKKIKIIPQFKNSKNPFFDEIIQFKKEIEDIYKGEHQFSYDLLHGEGLRDKFIKDSMLLKSIYKLVTNFENHPKIDNSKLNLTQNIKLAYDSYSFISNWFKNKKINVLRKVTFSKIQHEGNYATFYFSYSCGDLCGYGGFAFMEKIKGKWIFLGTFEMWMS